MIDDDIKITYSRDKENGKYKLAVSEEEVSGTASLFTMTGTLQYDGKKLETSVKTFTVDEDYITSDDLDVFEISITMTAGEAIPKELATKKYTDIFEMTKEELEAMLEEMEELVDELDSLF